MTSRHFLGSAGYFDPAYGNSAALVRHESQTLLLDCGFTGHPEAGRRTTRISSPSGYYP